MWKNFDYDKGVRGVNDLTFEKKGVDMLEERVYNKYSIAQHTPSTVISPSISPTTCLSIGSLLTVVLSLFKIGIVIGSEVALCLFGYILVVKCF